MPNSLAISIQPTINLKSQWVNIITISAAISTRVFNRFRSDWASILRSAPRFQIAILLQFEIAAIAILRFGHLSLNRMHTKEVVRQHAF